MKVRNIILGIAAAAIVASPAAVFAQAGPGQGPGAGPGPHGGFGRGFDHGHGFGAGPGLGDIEHLAARLDQRLDLSDAQMSAIESIMNARRPVIEGYVEQLRDEREAYREAHADPTDFDETSFRAHAERQARIQADLMVAVHSTRAEILSQLTPEQLAELEETRGAGKRHMRRSGACPDSN